MYERIKVYLDEILSGRNSQTIKDWAYGQIDFLRSQKLITVKEAEELILKYDLLD